MSTFGIKGYSLPTLDKLDVTLPQDIDPQSVALDWFQSFSKALSSKNVEAVAELCLEDVFWRDMLALTWDFRTVHGKANVAGLLTGVFSSVEFNKIAIDKSRTTLERDYPDTAWVQAFFSFETKVASVRESSGWSPLQLPTHNKAACPGRVSQSTRTWKTSSATPKVSGRTETLFRIMESGARSVDARSTSRIQNLLLSSSVLDSRDSMSRRG